MTDPRRQRQDAGGYRPLSRRQRVWMAMAAPLVRGIARLLLATCRLRSVAGREHLDALIAAGQPVLLCCWHRRLCFVSRYLLAHRGEGLRPGFLVSPSRDGEFMARVASGFGAVIVRGSAHRTGARALRDMYGVIGDGVSPMLYPDGPHGPAHEAKPGIVLLARMTRAPMLPISFAASRYWQLGSWDKLIVPKPFARITLAIGPPVRIARGDDITARAAVLRDRLNAADMAAERACGLSADRLIRH